MDRVKFATKKHSKKTIHAFHGTLILTLSLVLLFATGIVIYQTQQIQNLRGHAQTNVNCTVNTAEIALDTEEKKMLDLINAYRKANGKPELKVSPTLSRAALWLSTDMNTKKYLSHTDSLNRGLQTRLGNCGYPGYTSGSSENIAQTGSADATFETWKNSAVHNANMLNENWKVVGLARNGIYWTYDAGYVDDSASPTLDPSTGIPSPVCLGACLTPSLAPATVTPTTVPTATTVPTVSPTGEIITPTEPVAETPTEGPTTTPVPNGGGHGTNTGLLSLFLNFIIKLLEFFASLLK